MRPSQPGAVVMQPGGVPHLTFGLWSTQGAHCRLHTDAKEAASLAIVFFSPSNQQDTHHIIIKKKKKSNYIMPPKPPWSADASEHKRFKSEPTAIESFDFHRSRYFLGMHSQP